MKLCHRPYVAPEDEDPGEKKFIYCEDTGECFFEVPFPHPSKPEYVIFSIYLRNSIGKARVEHVFDSMEEMDKHFTMPNSPIKRRF